MSLLALAGAALSGTPPVISVIPGTYTSGIPGQEGSYSLESDGDVIVTPLGADVGDWITPKGYAPGGYEARATLNSGTLISGTTGSWLALSSTRTWSCGVTATANLTIEIRDASGVVQASGTVIISGGGSV